MAAPALRQEAARTLLDTHPLPSGEAGWAREARARAEACVAAEGLPGRRDEYWRFTNPEPLTAAAAPGGAPAAGNDDPFAEVDRLRLVFVDGVFVPGLSDAPEAAGVEIQPLGQALAADIHWAREVFGRLEAEGQDPVARVLLALNTARATAGVAIRATAAAARPVAIEYRHTAAGSDALVHHVVRVEAGAALTLLENGRAGARANVVTEVDVADGGAFHHIRAQGSEADRLVTTGLFLRLARESQAKSFTLAVGGRLTRNEAVITFTGDDAAAHVAGASIGGADFLHDDTVFITHDGVNCESRQVFKKVLSRGATGVFQGKILVRPGAQKTDGYQISQGLLLDDEAQFLAKPELEIYADDVACSHGSTCGAVDPTALFYLMSRGVARREAEHLMVLAFLDEAVAEIEDPALADLVRAGMARWIAATWS